MAQKPASYILPAIQCDLESWTESQRFHSQTQFTGCEHGLKNRHNLALRSSTRCKQPVNDRLKYAAAVCTPSHSPIQGYMRAGTYASSVDFLGSHSPALRYAYCIFQVSLILIGCWQRVVCTSFDSQVTLYRQMPLCA